MNPFEIVQNFEEEADMLAGLVSQMAAPTDKLSDFQTAGLKRVLKNLWAEKAQAMSVDDIAAIFCREDDQRLSDVSEQLFLFMSRGEYVRYFNGRRLTVVMRLFTGFTELPQPVQVASKKAVCKVVWLLDYQQPRRRCCCWTNFGLSLFCPLTA
jgi:type IV secretory pathway VirB4 component